MNITPGVKRLHAVLEKSAITQRAMAGRLKVSEPFLSQILSGQRRPGLDLAAEIERLYRIPARDFARKAA